ncbi:HK97-gp10 family putative phage morphogenesis protein [uncultured Nitratireductor sp.]|uniref:HK97-gp10 family putative phage morphogenesis protein n=1 Tax=uncultured Nitratireductor sp. TaxID=520953 RepID=UPI0025E55422|nr:HK97-gp10 family putative phage morphogenesis protein [uncultured Nitratireductor sp.]
MATNVRIEGLRELDKALAELPKSTGKNVLRRTLREAAKPLINDAQRLAPDRPGRPRNDLPTSITISTRLNKNQRKATRGTDKSFVEMYVGPDVSVPHPHGHWQEFGTVQHGPQPFMRPAWDANKMEVLDVIGDQLGDEIMRAAKRLAKKQAKAAAKGK